MKKLYFITSICLLMLVFTGCMNTESSSDKNSEAETETGIEDVIEALDWTSQQITADLTQNFSINATITSNSIYEKEFGLYNYEEFSEDDYNRDELLSALTSYNEKYAFGDYTPDIYISSNSLELFTSLSPDFDSTGQYTAVMDTLDAFFPISNQEGEYDAEKITSIVDEFIETISVSTDFSSFSFRCLCWNQELRDKISSFADNTGISVLSDEEISDMSEDFYHVRILKEFEKECYFKNLLSISRPAIDGEQEGALTEFDINGDVKPIYCKKFIDIYLDKDYNVFAYSVSVISEINDTPFDTISVIPAKDILKSVYDKLKNSLSNVTVTDIRLVYSCYLDESLEADNTRTPYIAPYWIVTYYIEGNTSCYQMYYSAIDGALIYSVL